MVSAMLSGQVAKAYLEPLDGGVRLEFAINPETLSVNRSITYAEPADKGVDTPERDFVRGEGRKISFKIYVDEYENDGDAQLFVKKLHKLVDVDTSNEGEGKKPRPGQVQFGWGTGTHTSFKAVITQINANYTLFHSDGRCARAEVDINLTEIPDPAPNQNPTTGGNAGRTSHLVTPGETLDLIAYRELGDAGLWKQLAEMNDLDDPWAIRAGQRLVIARPE